MPAMRALLGSLAALLVLAGCAASGAFEPGQLAKTDVDRVADTHRRDVFAHLRLIAEKLYRRNPREWKKGGQPSMEAALARLFDASPAWRLPELGERRGTEAVLLALREDYRGDRVAAFVAGVADMSAARFTLFNVVGAATWVGSLCLAGYFFGNLPFIKNNLTLVIVGIIVLSLVPLVIGWARHRLATKNQ